MPNIRPLYIIGVLFGFADSKHLRTTSGAGTLSCGFGVFHCYRLWILHLFLNPAFHTISFHFCSFLSNLTRTINHLLYGVKRVVNIIKTSRVTILTNVH